MDHSLCCYPLSFVARLGLRTLHAAPPSALEVRRASEIAEDPTSPQCLPESTAAAHARLMRPFSCGDRRPLPLLLLVRRVSRRPL
jgi:hypothetical protein